MTWTPVHSFHQETHHPFVEQVQEWLEIQQLLKRVEERRALPAQSKKPPAFVFDLDSTLFCTAPRLRRIFKKYLRSIERPEMLWMRLADDLGSMAQCYSVPETFYRLLLRYQDAAAAEKIAKDLWRDFEPLWKEEFFLSRNIVGDPPYIGAVDFVHAVRSLGYSLVYLTGRDVERGLDGTAHTLRRWNFPTGPETQMILKPRREMRDLEFKTLVARTLASRFQVEFVIDNEPENLVMFAERIPSSEIIFYHSIMSRRLPQREWAQVGAGRSLLGLKSFADLSRATI